MAFSIPPTQLHNYRDTTGYAYDVEFVEVFFEVSTPAAIETLRDRTIKVVVLDGHPSSYAAVNWSEYETVADRFGLDK